MCEFGNFTFVETGIEGLVIVETKSFGDHRGYFMETYREEHFLNGGIPAKFVQDNQSSSNKGVLRGLHYQTENTQGKLVRVLSGEVYDVAVDLRKSSATYGQWRGVMLTGDNRKQFYVPEGFAHGFQVVSDYAEFAYKCTDFYNPKAEGGIMWNDPTLNIQWPISAVNEVKLSDKDKNLNRMDGFNSPF